MNGAREFVKEVWENITFDCPKCDGKVKRVLLRKDQLNKPLAWRWTCEKCQRDYGYGTTKPLFIEEPY